MIRVWNTDPFLQVRALPTVIAFRDGKDVMQFVGALPAAGVRDFLQKV